MKAVCHNCGGQGYTTTFGIYDCTAAGCDVAQQRTALEAEVKKLEARIGPITREELAWFSAQWAINNNLEK